MNPFVKWYGTIQGLLAVAALSAQSFVIKCLITAYDLPRFIYLLLAASSTYYIIYRISVFIYEKWAWKLVLKKYNIGGIWYHEFQSVSEPTYHRRGITVVKQTALGIRINAVNYDPDFDISRRTLWNDTSVSIDETCRLVVSYVAHTSVYRPPISFRTTNQDTSDFLKKVECPEKTGVMYLTILHDKHKRPLRIEGIFHDSSLPFRRGTVTWWRKADWQDKVDKMESMAGQNSCA